MNLLELFSGTGSVGRIARDLGFNVISLDLKNADTNTDILKWDYRQFDRNHFDFIWSSPPPTQKRTKHTHAPKNRPEGNPKGQPNDPPNTHTQTRRLPDKCPTEDEVERHTCAVGNGDKTKNITEANCTTHCTKYFFHIIA